MKKLIGLLVLLFVLTLGCSAFAEEAVLLWENSYIVGNIGEETEYVYTGDRQLGYGLASLDGTIVIPMAYGSISFASLDYQGLFTVANSNDTNNLSLIDLNNNTLTERTYGDVEIINNEWFVGVELRLTTGDDYDYSSFFSNNRYIAVSYDVYNRNAGKVLSLQRSEYKYAEAFGSYLLISDRNGKVQLYDQYGNAIQSAFSAIYDCEFYVDEFGYVVSRITGEKITSRYTSISSLDGNYFVVSDKPFCYGIIDHEGNLLLDTNYDYINYNSMTHAIKVKQNNLVGLFDKNTETLLLPCVYDDIIAPDLYRICNNGYYMVEKDKKVGYVNAQNEITCPISYNKAEMTLVGCTMYATDTDGAYKLVAADGTVTVLEGVTAISKYYNSPSGYYIVVQNKDGLWGIMDWHGNLVFNYDVTYDSQIDFVDDTHFIYDNSYVYKIQQ